MVRKPIQNFNDNIKEVQVLLNIHKALTGERPGRRHRFVAVLNRSGIVLLVACWEAFVEDLADKTFSALLTKAQSPFYFPKEVQKFVAKAITDDKNELKMLELAGNSWKSVFKQYKAKTTRQFLGNFNTPSVKKIDELFSKLIGLNKLSKSWSWSKIKPTSARKRLMRVIKLRGIIAHRVKFKRPIQKKTVEEYLNFIQHLAVVSNARVDKYLKSFNNMKK